MTFTGAEGSEGAGEIPKSVGVGKGLLFTEAFVSSVDKMVSGGRRRLRRGQGARRRGRRRRRIWRRSRKK